MPQGPYEFVNIYNIPINGEDYGFYTLVSKDGIIAWMPDSEQQHVNPQFRDIEKKQPVTISDFSQWDVGRIIGQILLFQTKQIPLEDIISKYKPVINRILQDFSQYPLLKKVD